MKEFFCRREFECKQNDQQGVEDNILTLSSRNLRYEDYHSVR